MNIAHFSRSFFWVILLSATILTACGGGDSGSGGGDPADDSDPAGGVKPVEITCGTDDRDGDRLPDCYEQYLGTSIVDADTDGDGLDDGTEVIDLGFNPSNNNLKFNPWVADVPHLSFEFTSIPKIEVNYNFNQGQSTNEALGATTGFSESQSTSTTDTTTTSIETSVSSSASLTDFGVSSSVTMKQEHSFSYTQEQSTENSRGFSKLNETSNTTGFNYENGSLAITIKITNEGHQSIHLRNLVLSAVQSTSGQPGNFTPIGNLDFDGGFPADGFTIAPGASTGGTLIFKTTLTLAQTKAFLKDSSGLVIQPATWNIVDGIGDNARDFTDAQTAIGAKDATILVDFGPRSGRTIERYRVATTSAFNQDGISITQAMEDFLAIGTVQFGSVAWDFDGDGTAEGSTNNGIIGIKNVQTSAAENGRWVVFYRRPDPADPQFGDPLTDLYDSLEAAYDLTNVALKGGHIIEFIYLQDNDRDSIWARTEQLYGTSDDNVDSDGDGLSDADEINSGASHPALVDSDIDGLSDSEELQIGSNPGHTDSDNDTISDLCDATPTLPLSPDSASYTDNLVLCLAADELTEVVENAGTVNQTTTLVTKDDSGQKTRGTTPVSPLLIALGDPILTADRNGQVNTAIEFDGVDDVLESDLLPQQYAGNTVSVWFKPTLETQQGNHLQTIVMSGPDTYSGLHASISWDMDQVLINLVDQEYGAHAQLTPLNGAILNQWNHILLAVSQDNVGNTNIVNVFLNGVHVINNVIPVIVSNATESDSCCLQFSDSWRIGGPYDTALVENGFFEGAIDDVRIYDRTLSADEATELFETGHIVTPVPQ